MTKTMLSLMFGCHSLKRTAVDVLSGTAQRSQKSSSTKLYSTPILVVATQVPVLYDPVTGMSLLTRRKATLDLTPS